MLKQLYHFVRTQNNIPMIINKSGFSLIETMVSISLLSLLTLYVSESLVNSKKIELKTIQSVDFETEKLINLQQMKSINNLKKIISEIPISLEAQKCFDGAGTQCLGLAAELPIIIKDKCLQSKCIETDLFKSSISFKFNCATSSNCENIELTSTIKIQKKDLAKEDLQKTRVSSIFFKKTTSLASLSTCANSGEEVITRMDTNGSSFFCEGQNYTQTCASELPLTNLGSLFFTTSDENRCKKTELVNCSNKGFQSLGAYTDQNICDLPPYEDPLEPDYLEELNMTQVVGEEYL